MNKSRSTICVYCGIRPAVKDEHVIAECFFKSKNGDSLPQYMITVPACHECDRGKGDGGPRDFHLDEDYVAKTIRLKDGVSQHPIAKKLLPSAVRFIQRTPGLHKDFFAHWNNPQLSPRHSIQVDLHRFVRVIKKITRGLYYYNFGEILNAETPIQMEIDITQERFAEFLQCFNNPDEWNGWDNLVFNFRFAKSEDKNIPLLLLIVIYNQFACEVWIET